MLKNIILKMKGEKIIEKKLTFNVTTLVIHDKELSDRLLKEAIKEKTTNKTSLICDLLYKALDNCWEKKKEEWFN